MPREPSMFWPASASVASSCAAAALVTTLFARLVLSDLFIHGIGGAKYDQLTDELIRSFFGLAPPDYLVISATLHLAASTGRAVAPTRCVPGPGAARPGISSRAVHRGLARLDRPRSIWRIGWR